MQTETTTPTCRCTTTTTTLSTVYIGDMPLVSIHHIKRVIYNDPATIILWADGTKTVVKVHDEPFDKEKGFAMAVFKKSLGEKYHRVLRQYCE